MTDIREVKILSWQHFSEIADSIACCLPARTPFYQCSFRGHEDAEWKLESSLMRAATDNHRKPVPPARELLSIEDRFLTEFCSAAPNYLQSALLPSGNSKIEWWGLMRHYGIPTRLIDWTVSIYVAAYFAVSKQLDKDGVVYLLPHWEMGTAMRQEFGSAYPDQENHAFERPDAPPMVYTYGLPHASPDRVIAQQGGFMVCLNVVADIEEVLTTVMGKVGTNIPFTRIRIPAKLKPFFMRHLRSMNLTASSLFPGLDGIGRHLEEGVRCGDSSTEEESDALEKLKSLLQGKG
jgi:hypothetical protein